VTGVAGFIGSNLLEWLLRHNQKVVGVDNFSTGKKENLLEVEVTTSVSQWADFTFIEGDIRDFSVCRQVCEGVDFVLHEAALGSVPRSLSDPLTTNSVNIDGFLNMLVASRDAGVRRMVYAASSSTYGDHPDLPKREENIGRPLSPYAVTKLVNEIYADVFQRTYGQDVVGLRYFNVFGPRQDPNGPYAAVIPKWIAAMLGKNEVYINGDGTTSRDFCYVENVIQANVMAALVDDESVAGQVFNVAFGERTTLLELHTIISQELRELGMDVEGTPLFREFRAGDVRHSLASIEKASKAFCYSPEYSVLSGLRKALPWYVKKLR